MTDYAYEAGVQKFYSDRACTVPVSQTADYCLFALAEGRFTFTFGQDRVLGVTMATASGTTTVYIKNAFPAAYTSGEMRFGLADWGLLEIDNLVVSQPGKIYECDFDGDWKASSAEEGKCYGSGYKLIKADGLVSENTGSAHRMVLKNAVATDGLSVKYFSVEGKLSFDVLENSFGFCFGLPEKDSALEEGSYLRFYVAEDGTSRLACGEQDYLLPFDLVGYGYVEIAAEGLKGGILETVVCGQKYTFENVKFDGYIALAGNGEGAARVTVDKDLRIVKYAYQGSEGGEIATNFNTGFVDPDNWVMQNDKALYLADMTRANGVTFEDGRMNFDGAGMWAYFSTKQKYADYIVEFDYIQKHDLAVELKNGGYNGTFALCVASNAYAGNLNSYMISILYYPDINIVRMNDYSSGVYAGNYDFASSQVFYEEERDVVTAVNVVVANNKAIMYTQYITDAEFDKDAYVKAGEWTLEDTFGYVGIAADEGCFQSFDNFRITPIDHPDAAEVEKNIASFVDRKPIADEKFVLAAPVIVADEDGEISWDAVKGADGYIVTVNGVSSGMQTDTVYKPEGNGEYVVTVRAVGSGAWVTGNSEESNEIRVVIGNPEESGQPDSGSSASTGKSGCLSGLGTETAGLLLLLGAAVAVVRRKRIS